MGILFWVSIFYIFYVYVGYYFSLKIVSIIKTISFRTNESYEPSVSIIIAAHNEEKVIDKRINNLLGLDYVRDKLEIVIGSDGSTDKTVEKAEKFSDKGVSILDFEVKRGKGLVNNDCVRFSKGDILVFTDAETTFDEQFLRKIVKNFNDNRIGCVVGNLIYISKDNEYAKAEGFYFKYENALRKLESGLGILSSGTGACMSLRRNLFRELRATEGEDFTLPVECIKQGYFVVVEPEALAYDFPPGTSGGVLRTRIRTASKAFRGILKLIDLDFLFKHPLVSLSIISRRLMRWCMGYFMAFAFVSNVFLIGSSPFYKFSLTVQALFYVIAIAGAFFSWMNKPMRIPDWAYIFVVANIGMSIGVFNAIFGRIPSFYSANDEGSR